MSEFTQLEKSVIDQAHERGEKAVERARHRLESEYENQLDDRQEQMTTRFHSDKSAMRKELEQQTQQLQNKRRLLSLEAKQNILTELFASAAQKMNHWSRDEQLTFLYQVLNKYQAQNFSIKFGEYTRNQLTDEDIQALYQNFQEIHVEEEVFLRQGGFVITKGRIDYNYLYTNLVEASKEDLGLDIASRVFDKD
ncbi:hypothetical protein HYO62_02800 [Aerococcaceae bacterium DSM 111022]|nr:hypothetical protein [Aerococcaceae bacterium DSM 111022]